MKAKICTTKGSRIIEVEDIAKEYKVVGVTEDLSEIRAKGGMVCRAELDNQPIIEGFYEPMWDGGMLRYETPELYNLLSQ